MKTKKLICLILTVCMLLSTMSVLAFEETNTQISDITTEPAERVSDQETIIAEEAILFSQDESVSPLDNSGSQTLGVNVARVGNTEYATITEAVNAWTSTAESTLTLLADVQLEDTILLKSTKHHILNVGTFTMKATDGKNAIEIIAYGTGSAERSCITVNADSQNPGGIDAGSKSCIYYDYSKGTVSTEDRPIIKINGGVFKGSTAAFGTAGIYTKGSAARKCATLNVCGGIFNCTINGQGKSKLLISGGTFNYSVGSQGDSTAYRLISGGTFKTLGFMTADSNNTKFWIGSKMGVSDVGVYINDDGYLVVGGPVITEAGSDFEASAPYNSFYPYSSFSSYLQYSSAKANSLYYTSAKVAIEKSDNITLYTYYCDDIESSGEVIDCTDSSAEFEGDVKLKSGSSSFTIVLNDINDYHGVVSPADGYQLGIEKTVDSSTGKVTLKFSNYQNIDETNAMAKVTDGDSTVYYKTLTDALYAVDGTKGKTVTLIADATSEILITNGDAASDDGKTDVTLDLNGYKFGLEQSTIGNNAKYSINVTDTSVSQSGEVVTDIAGKLKLESAGSSDGAGTFELIVSGGNWMEDMSSYTKDGKTYNFIASNHSVKQDENGAYVVYELPTKEISVKFEKTSNGVYNIVLDGNGGYINELVSAQLTFTNNSVLLDGESEMKYTVSGTDEFDVQLDNQDIIEENAGKQDEVQKWAFSANTKTLAKSGKSFVIGTIIFDGFGTADFAVTGNDNIVKTTILDTNNEDTYVVGGANSLNLADAVIDGEAVEAPLRDVTINIDFKNDLSGVKAAKYNDMTVTVENAKLGFKEIYKIGKKTTEADQDGVEYIDNYTNELATIETTLFANYQYTVTLEGAGYRTYKYVTTVDEGNDELVLTFWNNAKKENSTVDPFISVEKDGKEIRTTFLAGDISMDNTIDKYDLAAVVSYFGTYDLSENNNPQYAKYDLNRDGKIDAEDIAYVLYSFGY